MSKRSIEKGAMPKRKRARLPWSGLVAAACLVLALAVFLSACGSSGEGSSGSTATEEAAGTEAEATGTEDAAAEEGTGEEAGSSGEGFGLSPAPAVAKLVPASFKGRKIPNAIYNDGAPEQFLEDGELAGIQPDFAQAVSEVMGVEFENIAVGGFDSIIPGLQGGRYEVAFADFGITAEREEVIDFVQMFDLSTAFGVKSGSGTTIDKAEDLCGLTLATLAGSYFIEQAKTLSGECTRDGNPAIAIQTYPTQSAAVLAVANGRADTYAVSNDQLAVAAEESGALEPQSFLFEPVPQGIGMPKGSELAKPIQAAMKELVANGTYEKILAKWGIENAAISPDEMVINPQVE